MEEFKSQDDRFGVSSFSIISLGKHNCICNSDKMLEIIKIYTYEESVCAYNLYKNIGFKYCTLYLDNDNKTIATSPILQPDFYLIWRIIDNKEYGEIICMRH